MATISLLPPSLPDSSSTSAESLALGRHDEGDSQQPPFITEGELQYTLVMAQCVEHFAIVTTQSLMKLATCF